MVKCVIIAGCVSVLSLCAADLRADEKGPGGNLGPDELPVFVLAGQSNMAGKGTAKELPPDLRKEHRDVLLFTGGKWVPLKPGKRVGPEVSFGVEAAKMLKRPVGIIKLAVGGTALHGRWNPARRGADALYPRLVKTVKKAGKARRIRVLAMVWMQGERDARTAAAAAAYRKNLEKLVMSARRDFGNPRMAFVCGRVNPPYPHAAEVRKAQESVSLPAYAWVDCDDLSKLPDGLHYDTAGLVKLGRRFAEAAVRLLRKPQKEGNEGKNKGKVEDPGRKEAKEALDRLL